MLFEIPDYWTPEQALAVYELLDGLREIILSRYEAQIIDAFREECAPSAPPEPSDPSSDRGLLTDAVLTYHLPMPHLQTPCRRSGPPCSQLSRSGLERRASLLWRAGRPRPLLRASAEISCGRGGSKPLAGSNKSKRPLWGPAARVNLASIEARGWEPGHYLR